MADYRETIRTPSQNIVSTQNGNVFIDEAQGRMVIQEDGIEMLVITKDGIVLNDGTDRRMIIGKMPDSNIGVVISKPGEDVFDIFS